VIGGEEEGSLASGVEYEHARNIHPIHAARRYPIPMDHCDICAPRYGAGNNAEELSRRRLTLPHSRNVIARDAELNHANEPEGRHAEGHDGKDGWTNASVRPSKECGPPCNQGKPQEDIPTTVIRSILNRS
jgi:hypothetical protein